MLTHSHPHTHTQIALCDRPLREISNPGASGSLFYLSADDALILKTVQKKEAHFLQKLLPGYYLVSSSVILSLRLVYNMTQCVLCGGFTCMCYVGGCSICSVGGYIICSVGVVSCALLGSLCFVRVTVCALWGVTVCALWGYCCDLNPIMTTSYVLFYCESA